jgi:plastocyanin
MRRFLGVAAVICALVLSGCGAGTPGAAPAGTSLASTAPTSPTPGAAPKASSAKKVDPRTGGLDVAFGEFAVVPEAKAIRPGKVTLVVHNGGRLTHGFEMKDDDGRESGKFDGRKLKLEGPRFGPGDTYRVTVTLTPGLYEMECYIANHEQLGMYTRLEVRADAPLAEAAPAKGSDVSISGFAFDPATTTVAAGTTVTWRNDDPTEHTVTAADEAFESDILASGKTFAVTFEEVGTFRYHCLIHPSMEGTIKVTS